MQTLKIKGKWSCLIGVISIISLNECDLRVSVYSKLVNFFEMALVGAGLDGLIVFILRCGTHPGSPVAQA